MVSDSSGDRRGRPASGATARAARVLIVDDEPLLAQSLRLVLSDEFDVTATTDPVEALGWLTSVDWYDVILCDVMMPTMTGVNLRERVHKRSPEQAARIILVTGGIVMPSVQKMLESVPGVVLTKPFDLPALRELIRRRLRSDPPLPRASGR